MDKATGKPVVPKVTNGDALLLKLYVEEFVVKYKAHESDVTTYKENNDCMYYIILRYCPSNLEAILKTSQSGTLQGWHKMPLYSYF